MGRNTNISWTDATFNPWWGCAKVSPGCDNCYAEALDKRHGGNHWGSNPRSMSEKYWKNPLKWQRKAGKQGKRLKVFCGSMCDWTDNNAPDGQRERLWDVIRETPNLDWLLLTKRAGRIVHCLPDLQYDWENGYNNVWLGVTVEDMKHGLPRIDILREHSAKVKFLSVEPLLEDLGDLHLGGIDWVIVGGESGPSARPMKKEWVYNIWRQCESQDTPFFFKQWGGKKDKGGCLIDGHEIKEWPWVDFLK